MKKQNSKKYIGKNNNNVISAYLEGGYTEGRDINKSITFIDNKIYSYEALIGEIVDNNLFLNKNKYSKTTSTMQNQLIKEGKNYGYNILVRN
jgi:hypothetical protein